MSKYDYSLIADEDTRQYLELKEKYNRLEKEYKKLQVEHSRLLFDMDAVIEHEVDVKCKKLREENKQLKNKRVFSSEEYDLIILASTTPQWELRRK